MDETAEWVGLFTNNETRVQSSVFACTLLLFSSSSIFMFSRACIRYFSSQPSSFVTSFAKQLPSPTRQYQSRLFSITTFKMAQEFKLKDVTGLSDLKDLDKKEAEVEGIEGGKVLLVKLDGKVHALNSNCTHFGAPLKNGVVTSEGRITCPWHGGQYTTALPGCTVD